MSGKYKRLDYLFITICGAQVFLSKASKNFMREIFYKNMGGIFLVNYE